MTLAAVGLGDLLAVAHGAAPEALQDLDAVLVVEE